MSTQSPEAVKSVQSLLKGIALLVIVAIPFRFLFQEMQRQKARATASAQYAQDATRQLNMYLLGVNNPGQSHPDPQSVIVSLRAEVDLLEQENNSLRLQLESLDHPVTETPPLPFEPPVDSDSD